MRSLFPAIVVVLAMTAACHAGGQLQASTWMSISYDDQDDSSAQSSESESPDDNENAENSDGAAGAQQDSQSSPDIQNGQQDNQDEESDDPEYPNQLAYPEGFGYEMPAALLDSAGDSLVKIKPKALDPSQARAADGDFNRSKVIGMPNPASVNCRRLSGQSIRETRPSGGIFSVCRFKNGYECSEWAMFRKECPEGGVDVAGYATPASRYCVIIGGEFIGHDPALHSTLNKRDTSIAPGSVESASESAAISKEKGACRLPSGHICRAQDVWEGLCP